MTMRLRCTVLLALLWATLAHAHKPSDSYLSLKAAPGGAQIVGQWDIALRDFEYAVGLDVDGDAAITWGELRSRQAIVVQYALSHLSIQRVDGKTREECLISYDDLLTDQHVDGGYAVLRFHAGCAAPIRQLAVQYSLLFELDPNHRGLLELRSGAASQAAVFSQATPQLVLDVGASQPLQQVRAFIAEGIWHILHGYDHVLFLLTLLLPAVVLFRDGAWEPRRSLRDALLDVAKVVTAFTLAHSLTLSAAVLGWVDVPSRLVESAIACTVALGALNNLYPLVTERRWLVAFAFGLIHGFGFASVLSDLGLEPATLGFALFGFNVGVEIGQLAIVLALVPLAFLVRATRAYRRVFMPGGAVAIAAVAGYWFVTRAFDIAAPI